MGDNGCRHYDVRVNMAQWLNLGHYGQSSNNRYCLPICVARSHTHTPIFFVFVCVYLSTCTSIDTLLLILSPASWQYAKYAYEPPLGTEHTLKTATLIMCNANTHTRTVEFTMWLKSEWKKFSCSKLERKFD